MSSASPSEEDHRRAARKGFTRDRTVHADPVPAAPPPEALVGLANASPSDLATGRATHYEWEDFVTDILNRVQTIEDHGGGAAGQYLRFRQASAAATWTIPHAMNTKPSVTVVDDSGNAMWVETTYPDDNTTVLVFGVPATGYAYLRG